MRRRLQRPRVRYAALLLLTVALGLATRRFPSAFPAFIAIYAGDALWAATAFWLLAIIFARAATPLVTAAAAGVALAVELSQLYHAPWIDAIRAARFGGQVLGHSFLWSDLLCYAAGISLAALLDRALHRPARLGAGETSAG